MFSNVRVIPKQSARIRAYAQANPKALPPEIAKAVGLDQRVVELALSKGDKRRPKSVAK